MRLRLGLLLALALTLAPAASAGAEPAFKGTLNAATPKFLWESSGSGTPGGAESGEFHCLGGPFHCEYVLLNVEAAGDLALSLESPEGAGEPSGQCGEDPCASFQDVDGNLYKSDAAGVPQGDSLTNGDVEKGEPDCSTSNASESCKLKVEPGFYVLEVSYYFALEAPIKGTAELSGMAAPPLTPAEPTTPQEQPQQQQPQQQPAQQQAPPAQASPAPQAEKKPSAKKRRAACTKKAKKIKNKRKRAKALKRCKKIR